jgi:capsular exopolysaccharide synthesis family protein
MADGGSSVVTVTEYTGVVRRWFRVVIGVVLLGALLGTGLVLLQPGTYVSQARVQIRPVTSLGDDPNLDTSRLIDPETEVAIAGSQRVAERALALRTAAGQLGIADLSSPDVQLAAAEIEVDPVEAVSALERLAVAAVDEAHILELEASGADPAHAQALAQSTALAYLAFRREEAVVGNDELRLRLAEREQQLVAELTDLAAVIGVAAGDPAQVQALTYGDIAKRQELTVIGTRVANLEALTVDPGVVLTDAALPTVKEGLPLYAGPITGALVGLAVALTAVFLLDRSDDRLRSGRVELGALGVPLLGTAPVRRRPAPAGEGGEGTVASRLYPVNTAGGDAYRRLQGTLLFSLDRENRSVVLVAGVSSASAATTVAANLAAMAARAGRRTLIIGADLRNGLLARQLGTEATTGLSDVVLAGASLADSIEPVDGVDNLGLLAAGTKLDRPADVLQSESFARLMAAVGADYDLVVVEAPPVLRVADAVQVAGLCHGSIVVADGGSETRQAIADSVEQLRGVGSEVVGVVVADAK